MDIFDKVRGMNHVWDCQTGIFKTNAQCWNFDKEFYIKHIELRNKLVNDLIGDLVYEK